jgi:hypothetical protein
MLMAGGKFGSTVAAFFNVPGRAPERLAKLVAAVDLLGHGILGFVAEYHVQEFLKHDLKIF